MKIFVSWSGLKSKAVADIVKWWLELVIQTTDPWVSTADIHAGDRWADEVKSGLEDAKFGIICVTPSNQNSPWLNYEAGAISKQVKDATSKVTPLLIDINNPTEIKGPLAQFQATMPTKNGFERLALSINESMPVELKRPVENVKASAEMVWPSLEQKLTSIRVAEPSAAQRSRSNEDMLEELLLRVRDLDTSPREATLADALESLMSMQEATFNYIKWNMRPPDSDNPFPDKYPNSKNDSTHNSRFTGNQKSARESAEENSFLKNLPSTLSPAMPTDINWRRVSAQRQGNTLVLGFPRDLTNKEESKIVEMVFDITSRFEGVLFFNHGLTNFKDMNNPTA